MPENQLENFTQRMDYLLKEILHITGYQVKNDLSMSLSGVYSIVNGKVKPGLDFITKFCIKYDVSANYLLMGIEPILLKDIEAAKKEISERVVYEIDTVISQLNDVKGSYERKPSK